MKHDWFGNVCMYVHGEDMRIEEEGGVKWLYMKSERIIEEYEMMLI